MIWHVVIWQHWISIVRHLWCNINTERQSVHVMKYVYENESCEKMDCEKVFSRSFDSISYRNHIAITCVHIPVNTLHVGSLVLRSMRQSTHTIFDQINRSTDKKIQLTTYIVYGRFAFCVVLRLKTFSHLNYRQKSKAKNNYSFTRTSFGIFRWTSL